MDPKPNLTIKPLFECDECKKISKKSGCPLWQFVILDLSSFGMIITEPSGLLYLALHERNLNTSEKTPKSPTTSLHNVCVCVSLCLVTRWVSSLQLLHRSLARVSCNTLGFDRLKCMARIKETNTIQGSFCLGERLNRSFCQ